MADNMDQNNEDDVDGLIPLEWVYKDNVVYAGEEQVRSDARNSKSIGWSWCSINKGVYHTAIVIFLDNKPMYTVNWGVVTGTGIVELASDVAGKIFLGVIENPDDEVITIRNVIGNIKTENEQQVEDILDKLLKFDKEFYHILDCNCRDHVFSTLEKLGTDKPTLERTKNEMEEVKTTLEKIVQKARKSSLPVYNYA